MNRRLYVSGIAGLAIVLSGCAGTQGGIVPLRDTIASDKADFEQCANDTATRLIETTDYDPQTVATTALERCDRYWQSYTKNLQQLYTRQTRNITYGHLESRSQGFALNQQLHRRIQQRAEQARAAGAHEDGPQDG